MRHKLLGKLAKILGLILVAAVAGVFVWAKYNTDLGDAAAISQCRGLYTRAATAADTLAIDAINPLQVAPGDRDRPPCGMFRRSGKV